MDLVEMRAAVSTLRETRQEKGGVFWLSHPSEILRVGFATSQGSRLQRAVEMP